jgi:hypothetical protein
VSAFDLICAGRFEEAVAACTFEIESDEQPQSLLNRGTAHLRLGRHGMARRQRDATRQEISHIDRLHLLEETIPDEDLFLFNGQAASPRRWPRLA